MSARRRRRVVDFCVFLLFALSICFVPSSAQLVNGQFFTDGLSIVDAPAPNSQQNSGGNMPIAVDISGDGKLQNFQNTQLHSLTIYLVSSSFGVNVTVSDTPDFLSGEPGSTVKHLNFDMPTCLPAGDYNLTFYECFEFQGQEYFAITPIPVKLNSQAASNPPNYSCISPPPTKPEALPQQESGLPSSPWLPGSTLTSTSQSSPPSSASPPSSTSPPSTQQSTTSQQSSTPISLSPPNLAPTGLPSQAAPSPSWTDSDTDTDSSDASLPTQGLIVPISPASPAAGVCGHLLVVFAVLNVLAWHL